VSQYLFAYAIPPMDFGWEALPTVEQYKKLMSESDAGTYLVEAVIALVESATSYESPVGWEGDYRAGHEPRVVTLPDDGHPKLALIWKQDNNGTTVVVSQVQLPWLTGFLNS
jgi:hypothetical protein